MVVTPWHNACDTLTWIITSVYASLFQLRIVTSIVPWMYTGTDLAHYGIVLGAVIGPTTGKHRCTVRNFWPFTAGAVVVALLRTMAEWHGNCAVVQVR